ncbi:ethanolamine ammonia-lyase subunit EutC [Pokkaliibacter sp. MBI-7]|uniref:ethanolamine ammonia-lyase subunit EutC n=1 Tax=Pokkaliibacter sp. MBI-7 TaxID=3040600 RepID=UPI00244D56D5|nr:ethanolamine ammonia-lyase subunit EutC [Pokkaliibacter sp. MBI-7]MDH2434533.1 ethanolamine ammonia-lyase subunit EutC [Pokkaliibacter sp. MBI-7]
MSEQESSVVVNAWSNLRQFTDARIALGRAGTSVPTAALLAFQLDHARARDAVHLPLDMALLQRQLASAGLESLQVQSRAHNRLVYLQRPDWGRRLNAESVSVLEQRVAAALIAEGVDEGVLGADERLWDVAIVIVDGLSSQAVQAHSAAMVSRLAAAFDQSGLTLAPVVLVQQGRVAVGDEVAEVLRARTVVLLVGERPGLSSPDSLGIYFTYAPKVGLTDAARNCISNIRPAGLSYEQACGKLMYLLLEANRRGLSGVQLKDESEVEPAQILTSVNRNFLLPKE